MPEVAGQDPDHHEDRKGVRFVQVPAMPGVSPISGSVRPDGTRAEDALNHSIEQRAIFGAGALAAASRYMDGVRSEQGLGHAADEAVRPASEASNMIREIRDHLRAPEQAAHPTQRHPGMIPEMPLHPKSQPNVEPEASQGNSGA